MAWGLRCQGKVLAVAVMSLLTLAGCSGPSTKHIVATFTPSVENYSSGALAEDASVIDDRLSYLGYAGASAHVRRHHVVVEAQKPLTVSDLQVLGTEVNLQIRPVLCFAPLFVGGQSQDENGPAPYPQECMPGLEICTEEGPGSEGESESESETSTSACSPAPYALTASNLAVKVDTGQPTKTVQPDPALAEYPSSTPEYNDNNPVPVVLLPGNPRQVVRYLLGTVGVSNTDIQSAVATYTPAVWMVDLTLTSTGAAQWDALAQQQFHAYVAVDLDGQVISDPLIEPTQDVFSSFDGKEQISGNFTKTSAQELAAFLNFGPLAVPLERTS